MKKYPQVVSQFTDMFSTQHLQIKFLQFRRQGR